MSSNTVRIDFNIPSNSELGSRGYSIHNSVPSIFYFWFHWDAGGWWYRYGHDANNTSQARGFGVGLNGLGFYNQAGYFAPVAGNGTYKTNAQGNYWIDGMFVGGDYSGMSNGALAVRNWEITISRAGFGPLKDLTGYRGTGYLLVSSAPILATATPTVTPTFTPTSVPTTTPTPPSGYTYNRNVAVAYADDWAHGRNTNYPNYGVDADGDECDDCTNYLSQVLEAGGIPQISGSDDEFHWYTYQNIWGTWLGSKSWAATDWFNNHVSQFQGVRYEFYPSGPSSLSAGDFFLMDLPTNPFSGPDHARVIMGMGTVLEGDHIGEWMLLVSQHCIDRKRVRWDYNIPEGTTGWAWRVVY